MVRAVRGEKLRRSIASRAIQGLSHLQGVLIEVDPAIKAIILDIDRDNHEFVIEDLDETHLLITENMHELLKKKLDDVGSPSSCAVPDEPSLTRCSA